MSEKRTFDDVVEAALETAVRKIMEEEGFSLVGMALDDAGEMRMLKILAENDAQMFSNARRALEMGKTTAFCLVGTGQMMIPGEGPLDVLIAYTQQAGERKTLCRYASYEVYEEQGRPVFSMSDWFDDVDRLDPWI